MTAEGGKRETAMVLAWVSRTSLLAFTFDILCFQGWGDIAVNNTDETLSVTLAPFIAVQIP